MYVWLADFMYIGFSEQVDNVIPRRKIIITFIVYFFIISPQSKLSLLPFDQMKIL
jgi:hypothetical protein